MRLIHAKISIYMRHSHCMCSMILCSDEEWTIDNISLTEVTSCCNAKATGDSFIGSRGDFDILVRDNEILNPDLKPCFNAMSLYCMSFLSAWNPFTHPRNQLGYAAASRGHWILLLCSYFNSSLPQHAYNCSWFWEKTCWKKGVCICTWT